LSEVRRTNPEDDRVVKENNEISCPCGTTIYLVTDELVRIIDELEGAIGRLIRTGP
jgi:hypothetical protein